MFTFLLWCLLFILCWPLALIALIAYPFVWLILLPFRLLGIAVHDHDFITANRHVISQANDRAFRSKVASRQLIGRTDPVYLLHTGQQFEQTDVDFRLRAHRAQHRLPRARGTMNLEAQPHQVIDYLLNLFFTRRFLHCNDHRYFATLASRSLASR